MRARIELAMLEALSISETSPQAHQQRVDIWMMLLSQIVNECADDAESFAVVHLRDCSEQSQAVCDGIAQRLRTRQGVRS